MNSRTFYFFLSFFIIALLLIAGCDQLRFAPNEIQKQNAWLHQKTSQAAATQAKTEEASPVLQSLTSHAAAQSEAITAYYGPPKELPPAATNEDILSESNLTLTVAARQANLARPDPWDIADNLLEVGIAVAGLFGGALGVRAVKTFQEAREKSNALREIVQGSELFKQNNPQAAQEFKTAQASQSPATRQLVAQLKQ